MREILFRGKLLAGTSAGEWVYGNLDVKPGQNVAIITPDDTPIGRYGRVDPDTVGEYTGLTDKNGVRIFEGDIVLKRAYNGKKPFPVAFDGGMFHCGYGGGSSTAYHKYRLDEPSVEVIGNIHDNPELLSA